MTTPYLAWVFTRNFNVKGLFFDKNVHFIDYFMFFNGLFKKFLYLANILNPN